MNSTLIFRKVRIGFVTLFLSFNSFFGFCQASYWTTTEQSGFPIFSGSSKSAAIKINTVLQSLCLNKVLNASSLNPLDQVDPWRTFQGYEVLKNDNRVLSLAISWEGCGAYCEYYTEYFVFSSATGNLITGSDLFERAQTAALRSKVSAQRNQMIEEQIAHLTAEIQKTDSTSDEYADLQAGRELFEECLSRKDESYVNVNHFYVKGSSVWLMEDRCSNHAMRALDDLDEFHTEIDVKNFGDVYSAFGKYILGLSNTAAPEKNILKLYSGSIASKYPITLMTWTGDEGLSYRYWYQKYGIVIRLKLLGSKSGQVSLQELDKEEQPNGTFQLVASGSGFKGKYINQAGKEMSVVLTLSK